MRHWLLFLAGLSLTSGLFAQGRVPPVPKPVPFLTERAKQFSFQAFEDDQGGYYLVWTQSQGDRYALFAQHTSSSGSTSWTDPGFVVAQGLPSTQEWDAFPDSKGGLQVVWTQSAQVHAQRLDLEHHPLWTDATEALTNSTFEQRMPTGVADGGGGVYVVWMEKRYADRTVLVGQHLSASGARMWGAEGQRLSLRPSDQRRPKVVSDGVAGIIAAWNDYREQSSQLQIQRLDYQGSMPWDPSGLLVTAPAAGTKGTPMVAAVGKGGAVVAWPVGDAGINRVYLQYIDGKGNFLWGPTGKTVSFEPQSKWNPLVYGDGQGGTWVGWEDYRSQTQWQVYLQHYHQDGNSAWEREIALAPAGGGQGNLDLADDGQGGFFAAWIDNRYGSPSLFAQQISAEGVRLWGDGGKAIAQGLAKPQQLQVLSTAPGKAMVFWADEEKNGRWALYFTSLSRSETSSSLH